MECRPASPRRPFFFKRFNGVVFFLAYFWYCL